MRVIDDDERVIGLRQKRIQRRVDECGGFPDLGDVN